MFGGFQNSGKSSNEITLTPENGKVTIEDAGLLFNGQFSRAGDDLQITNGDSPTIFVTDYFSSTTPINLISADGAYLTPDVVTRLAGSQTPGQYAQANTAGAASGLKQIGVVETIAGSASVTRSDGTKVELKIGDPVYQGDIVQTADGSAMGITFKDGTVFNMTASARMVLNNMVYEEGGSENAMLFSLVQGGFSFVAGKVAPTGDMKIDTPVATMGIRGTTPFVLIADNGKTTFSILPDPGSDKVGVYQLFHRESGDLIGTVADTGIKFDLTSANSAPLEIVKTAADLLADSQVQQNLSAVFNKAQQNPFNQGANPDGNNDDQQGEDGGAGGENGEGEQGQAVPGSGVTTAVVDTQPETAPADLLGEGAGTDLNEEAGADPGGAADGDLGDVASEDPAAGEEPPASTDDPIDPPDAGTGGSSFLNLPGTPTVTEDGSTTVTGFSFSGTNPNISVSMGAQSTVTLASTVGLTFTLGDGVNDENMAFSGSTADILNALNGLTYNPTADDDDGGGITITVDDGSSVEVVQLTVNITAVNDAPVVNTTSPGVETDGTVGSINLDVLAQTTIIDPDTLDNQSYVANSVVVLVNIISAPGVNIGLLNVDPVTGVITYNPADFSFMTVGDTALYIVAFDVQSGPDTVATSFNIEITGTNNVPIISTTDPAPVNEDIIAPFSIDINALTQTTIADPDTTDTQSYVASSAVATVNAGSAAGVNLGQITLNAVTGVFTYDPQTFGFLAAGESALFDLDFDVQSGPDTSSQQITIEITGVNDAPVIVVTDPAAVAEGDAGASSANVTVDVFAQTTITDADSSDVASYVLGSADVSLGAGSATGVNLSQVSLDDITGQLTYNPDTFDFLADGEVAEFDINFQVQSGADTSSETLTVTINGANDAPVISGDLAATVAEGGTVAITTTDLNFTDPDDVAAGVTFAVTNQVHGTVLVNGVAATSFTGTQLVASQVSFEHDGGETVSANFDVSVEDGNEDTSAPVAQTFNLAVTPVNDAPVVSGPVTGTATEDGATSSLSALANASDNEGSTLSVVNIPASLPSGVTFQAANGSVAAPAGFTLTNTDNITLANAQIEVGNDNSDNPNVANGIVGSLIAYTETILTPFGGAFDGANLDDGDIGTGVPSDGTYALPGAGVGSLTLDFGSVTTIGSIAIYNGYANRDDGSYTLKDGAGNVLGGWSISTPVGTSNNDVHSFWITFDTPVSTDKLIFDTTDIDTGGTNSYREIQVFGIGAPQFTIDPSDAAYQSLGAGQTQNVTVNYDVSDGTATTPASVSWTVTGVNDEPDTTPATATGAEDAPSIIVSLAGGDVDGAIISFKILSLPTDGILYSDAGLTNQISVNDVIPAAAEAAGVFFVPDADFNGAVSFNFSAIDNNGAEDPTPATANITVTAVNDAPVAVADIARATAVTAPTVIDDIDAIIVNDNHASALGTNATQLLSNDGSGGLTATAAVGATSARNSDVKLADFDEDGDLDAVTSSFQILENVGGTFSTSIVPGTTGSAQGLAVGDIDGDGDVDILTANWPNTANYVLTNQGGAQGGTQGSFVASTLAGGANHSRDIALADVDGDGDLDAIVANDTSTNQLLINQGGNQAGTEGVFVASNLASLETQAAVISTDIFFADVDGDGDQDALIANASGQNELLTNDGNGNFSAGLLAGGTFASTAIVAGDLDGDGDLDLVVSNNGGETNQVLINQGGDQAGTEGVFVASAIAGSTGSSSDVALVDIDGDGDLDAFITNNNFSTSAQSNQLLLNDGAGNFTVSTLVGGGNASNAIAFGDLDGDGAVAAVDIDGLPNINLSPVTGSVATNDSDVDAGAVLTYTLDAAVAGLTMASDGSYSFDPSNAAYVGLAGGATQNVVANYTVTDENSATAQSTLTITVTGVNDAPILNLDPNNSSGSTGTGYNDTFTEGGTAAHIGDLIESDLNITLVDDTNLESLTVTLTNRPDGAAESLSFSNVLPGGITITAYNPATGVIILTGTASKSVYEGLLENIVYTNTSESPDETDRIINVTVNDGDIDSNVAVATITVVGVNDAPVTTNSTITINEDIAHTFSIGDFPFSDVDGDSFVSIKVINPSGQGELRFNGTLVTAGQIIAMAAISNLIYTPPADASGLGIGDFTFQVFDGSVFSTTQTLEIDITSVDDDSPTAVNDRFEGVSGGEITGNLLTNDLNPDGPPSLTASAGTFTTEEGNIVTVAADGSFTFTAINNFFGFDSFIYGVEDAQGDKDSGYAEFVVNVNSNADQTLTGTSGNDILFGAHGADTINGLAGDDIIVGGGTSLDVDKIFSDIDVLDGGDGNDRIYAAETHTQVIGGTGDDILLAGESFEFSNGGSGAGATFVNYSSSTGSVLGNFTAGAQTIAGTFLERNEVADGFGDTDWVKGFEFLIDSSNDDEFQISGTDSNLYEVLLSGGDDTVTFSNFGTSTDSGISYRLATSGDGTVGVNANIATGTATGITSANVILANPFISAAGAPATNTSIGTDTFIGDVYELTGSEFNDQLEGNTLDNIFYGLGGNDYIRGDSGSDAVGYLYSPAAVNVDLSTSQASDDGYGTQDAFVSIENVYGSLFNDTITGDGNANVLVGFSGDDTISGGAGNDILSGGGLIDNPDFFDGDDTLDGGDGDDIISGGTGDDIITGGIGIDTIDGGNGSDLINGGAGNDIISSGGTKQDTFSNFFADFDRLNGDDGNDTLTINGGYAIVEGGAGNDTIIDVGAGTNFDWANVTYTNSTSSIQANLSNTGRTVGGTALGAFEVADGLGGTDNVQRMHVLRDSDFDDTIYVDDTYDNSFSDGSFRFMEIRLSGGDDNVTFNVSLPGNWRVSYQNASSIDGVLGVHFNLGTGTATGLTTALIDAGNTLFTTAVTVNTSIGTDTFTGANYARGSKFNDQLIGDGSDEKFRGSQGDDYIDGGGGIDWAEYNNSFSGVTANLTTGVVSDDGFGDQDQLVGIENIRGSWQNDDLTGDANDNQLRGQDGDDVLNGLAGNDTLRGGSGSDQLFGGDDNDTLRGEGAPDLFSANGDFLDGGAGNDTLIAGGGFTLLRGGAGDDFLQVSIGTDKYNDFTIADYTNASTSVKANLSDTGRTLDGTLLNAFEVEDGEGGTDTIATGEGVHVIRDGAGDDTIYVDNTYSNSYGNWIETRLSAGDDDVTFNGVSRARISYRNAASQDGFAGVHADLLAGTAVGLTAALIDGANTFFTTGLATNTSIGSDTFTGANRLRGSNFSDQLFGDNNDNQLRGGQANDFIDGRGGNDTIAFSGTDQGVIVDLSANLVSNDGFGTQDQVFNVENVNGSIGSDSITGDANANSLKGNAGSDMLSGLGGDDTLIGDFSDPAFDGGFGGNDQLLGGDGNDTLKGGTGNDDLRGGDQADFLIGGKGDDFIDGGDDFYIGTTIRSFGDQVSYADSDAAVFVDFAHGFAEDGFGTYDALINVEGVRGSAFDDTLLGGNTDNDQFEDFRGLAGNDFIDGGSGFDRARFNDAPAGAVVNLSSTAQFGAAAGTALDGHGTVDTLFNIESIVGSGFDDTLVAHDLGVQFRPLEGNDTIIGGAGIDEIDYAFTSGANGVTVDLGAGSNQATDTFGDTDQLTGIENVRGSFLADTITGDADDNVITGLQGADIIDGGGAGDSDTINYSREVGALLDQGGTLTTGVTVNLDTGIATDLFGDTDTLSNIENIIGTFLVDTLTGDAGDNRIRSGDGADILAGGFGADTFDVGAKDTGIDVITDFDPSVDRMDISDLLDAAFTPGTAADFVQATFDGGSGDTTFSVDSDGTANGVNFVDIATLEGIGSGSVLTYVYDDADNTTTVTSV